jgi:8-oxo-dGTP pyrophosphatase MutT (NUDIX family)
MRSMGKKSSSKESASEKSSTAAASDSVVFKGKLITVHTRAVRRPDGKESRYEIVDHPDAVAIVALRYEGQRRAVPPSRTAERSLRAVPRRTSAAQSLRAVPRRAEEGDALAPEPLVALVHQQRPVVGKVTIELPAGLVDPGEEGHPEQAALRELREETGYTADDLRLLTREYSSPGFTDEAIYIYLATALHPPKDGAQPDPDEIARLEWLPLGEAMDRCRNGTIDDSKTIIGLWLARDVLTRPANTPAG